MGRNFTAKAKAAAYYHKKSVKCDLTCIYEIFWGFLARQKFNLIFLIVHKLLLTLCFDKSCSFKRYNKKVVADIKPRVNYIWLNFIIRCKIQISHLNSERKNNYQQNDGSLIKTF